MVVALFGLGLFFSQFYIFPSGIPQPAHYLLLLASLLLFLRSEKLIFAHPYRRFFGVLALFFFYSLLVNISFSLIFGDYEFILSSIYILYGLMIVFFMLTIAGRKNAISTSMSRYAVGGMAALFLMGVLGYGSYAYFPRYNAFFNDPNQMAFWALCVLSIILIGKGINFYLKMMSFLFALYIIVLSASRSGLVGFSILVLGFVAQIFFYSDREGAKKNGLYFLFSLASLLVGLYFISQYSIESISFFSDRVDVVDVGEQSEIRGYTRIVNFPEYIFFGSGQGLDERFTGNSTEIHSTWAGLLFYYGLPGLFFVIYAIYLIFTRLDFPAKLIFLGPLFYSFSTYGLRTPIFWIFLSLSAAAAFDSEKNSHIEKT